MKKVLVLGSTGMLGHIVHYYLDSINIYELYNLSFRNKLNSKTIIEDVSDQQKLSNLINEICPDVIINCIGILIKGSNENIKNAIYINGYFPHWLKDICKEIDCKLIHISTDCVFSGKNGGNAENSIKDAIDDYGKTKSLGEFDSLNHLCIRTSIIGPELKQNGEGLMHWLFNHKGIIYGFQNAYWSGVTTLELAKAIHFSIENNISGLWNFTNGEPISKFELIEKIIKIYSLKNRILKPSKEKYSNKSLISTRGINFNVPSYDQMLKELLIYFKKNIDLYSYKLKYLKHL
jgi:dTDP-4-dehydrorhamnose reductase